MSANFVDFEDFKVENVVQGSLEERPIPESNSKYRQLPIQYNYGTDIKPEIDDLYLQLPTTTSTGVREDVDAKTQRVKYSCMLRFKNIDETHQKCIEIIGQLHKKCAEFLYSIKGQIGFYDFNPKAPGGMFKNPIYFPRNKTTGDVIPGKDPSFWLKLITYSGGKTLFTDLNQNPVSWNLLKNVNMKFIPLVKFEKIYIGTKASLQCKLQSAIILEVHQAGTQTRQIKTIEKILKNQPNLAKTVEKQLAELQMEKQDNLMDNSNNDEVVNKQDSPQLTEDNSVSSSLNDFLMGNEKQQSPNVPQIPTSSQTIQIPSRAPNNRENNAL